MMCRMIAQQIAMRLACCAYGAEATMRSLHISLAHVVSLVLLTLPGAASAQNRPNAAEADSAAIKQVCGDFSENFSRHDAHGVAMTFAEDPAFTTMGGRPTPCRTQPKNCFPPLFPAHLTD